MGVGPFPQTAENAKKRLVGLSKNMTPVVHAFGQKRLLPKKMEIGSPRAAMVRTLILGN
jgi:hypothetical protein